MNSEEAKDILQLCRPDHVDDLNDALITEALEQLERDSALCVWFEEQQAVDAEISAELSRIMPAPGLKESILAGTQKRFEAGDRISNDADTAKISTSNTRVPVTNEGSRRSKILWFNPLIGIAAVLTVASILLALLLKRPAPALADDSLRTANTEAEASLNVVDVPDVIQFLGNQIANFNSSKFEKRSERIDDLQIHLAQSRAPNPAEIPSKLQTIPTIGCVTFDYNGTKMSMICFKDGKVYHLITANKFDFKDDPVPNNFQSGAQFFEHQNQAFKVWSEGNQIYILCTDGTKEDIPEFI